MKVKKVLGIVLIVAGIVLLGFSSYIRNQVAQGKVEISSGQRKVDQANSLFGMSPATEPVGKMMTSGAQDRIDAGQKDVDYYENMAHNLFIGGIVLIVLGVILFILGFKKKRS